jgi:hypothetical protein
MKIFKNHLLRIYLHSIVSYFSYDTVENCTQHIKYTGDTLKFYSGMNEDNYKNAIHLKKTTHTHTHNT